MPSKRPSSKTMNKYLSKWSNPSHIQSIRSQNTKLRPDWVCGQSNPPVSTFQYGIYCLDCRNSRMLMDHANDDPSSVNPKQRQWRLSAPVRLSSRQNTVQNCHRKYSPTPVRTRNLVSAVVTVIDHPVPIAARHRNAMDCIRYLTSIL